LCVCVFVFVCLCLVALQPILEARRVILALELNALEDRGLVRRRVAAAAWEGEQARRADEGAMRQVQEVSERLLEKRHAQEVCFGLSECVAAHTRMRSRKSDYALARYGVRASC
jgi:hypothetical protein